MSQDKRLPKLLLDELEGVDWRLEHGHGHRKLFVMGRLAGVMPVRLTESDQRATFNTRSNIRRILKENRA